LALGAFLFKIEILRKKNENPFHIEEDNQDGVRSNCREYANLSVD
jgi:hypothetical protein